MLFIDILNRSSGFYPFFLFLFNLFLFNSFNRPQLQLSIVSSRILPPLQIYFSIDRF
jgi:hypothetical protein